MCVLRQMGNMLLLRFRTRLRLLLEPLELVQVLLQRFRLLLLLQQLVSRSQR